MTADPQVLIPTYQVVSRHSADCPHKAKGREYVQCNCKKHIAVYNPNETDPNKRQSIFPAKTRSYRDAELTAQIHRDKHNPDKQRVAQAEAKLQAMKAEKELQTASIEKAIVTFYASKKTEGTSQNRIKHYYSLLGNIDPRTLAFVSDRQRGRGGKGRLFEWLDSLSPRPQFISDLTPVLIEEFRGTWNFSSDLTHRMTFCELKEFFNFCVAKTWIEKHPMAGMKARKVKQGSRTTAFSDKQYDSIIKTVKSRFPEGTSNLDDKKQYEDVHRLLAFIELMRWGGLALEDAVRFELTCMQDNGRVSYPRVKTFRRTGRKAKPTLLPHVVSLLRATVPVDGDANRPFYDKNVKIQTNKNRWAAAVKEIFAASGIDMVKTDIREREPHCHMLRDTFAVSRLITQYKLGQVNHQEIADELGDTVAVFLKHYAPVIEELEEVKMEARQRIVDAQAEEWARKQQKDQKVMNIGGRR